MCFSDGSAIGSDVDAVSFSEMTGSVGGGEEGGGEEEGGEGALA